MNLIASCYIGPLIKLMAYGIAFFWVLPIFLLSKAYETVQDAGELTFGQFNLQWIPIPDLHRSA
jgi:hypothetical protein